MLTSKTVKIKLITNYIVDNETFTLQSLSGGFKIDNQPEFDVKLITPNGGEVITTNELAITWQFSGNLELIDSYELYYSANSGKEWTLITNKLDNATTSFEWNITHLDDGSQYLVKVKAVGSFYSEPITNLDISDSTFRIAHDIAEDLSDISDINELPDKAIGFDLLISIISLASLTFIIQKRFRD